MEVINKIAFGILQGITEILPVSSSGHLIIFSKLLNTEIDLTFLTFLHFCTALAIIFGFWEEIKDILRSKKKLYLAKILALAILPTAVVAIFIHGSIEQTLYKPIFIIISLISVGILMIFVDRYFQAEGKAKSIEDVKEKNSFIVGLAQILALIPGVSRSGITVTTGIITGMNRSTAIAFSFLIGLPLITFSFLFDLIKSGQTFNTVFTEENLIGGVSAFVFAYFSIWIFKKLVNKKFLTFFGFYRIALGIILIFTLLK